MGRDGGLNSDTLVLICLDDPLVRNMVRFIIQSHGYSCLVACNAEEALTLSRAHRGITIDLLLTDVSMPHTNGDDVVENIIAERPAVRVLMVSDLMSDETRETDFVFPILERPFMPQDLLTKLREVLSGPPSGSPSSRKQVRQVAESLRL